MWSKKDGNVNIFHSIESLYKNYINEYNLIIEYYHKLENKINENLNINNENCIKEIDYNLIKVINSKELLEEILFELKIQFKDSFDNLNNSLYDKQNEIKFIESKFYHIKHLLLQSNNKSESIEDNKLEESVFVVEKEEYINFKVVLNDKNQELEELKKVSTQIKDISFNIKEEIVNQEEKLFQIEKIVEEVKLNCENSDNEISYVSNQVNSLYSFSILLINIVIIGGVCLLKLK